MTVGAPLLVVTVPARTVAIARREIAQAREDGADVVELRLDRWSAEERTRVAELFPSAVPLMATVRSRSEGGEGPDSAEERRALLAGLARLPFRWLDLEEARDLDVLSRLPAERPIVVVLSAHLPEATPPAELVERSRRALPSGALRKLVVPATVGRLLGEILPALRAVPSEGCVVLTTGASGPLLRAWSMRRGYPIVYAAPATHASGANDPPVEASQIPVDRLRRFFGGDRPNPLFALLGRPVAHSQSPYLHSRWMRDRGFLGLYVALEIQSETEFVEALAPLAEHGFRGANVTHPWKTTALASATRVGRGAELCGVANCLTFRDEEVEAENTDLAAALRRLAELRENGRWPGDELLVLGAGGSAAATLAAARELPCTAHVMARSAEKAEALAERFGAHALSPDEVRPFSLVVNATDVGRAGAAGLELPLERAVSPGSVVLDWVYSADEGSLRRIVRSAGGEYEDGWRLLVYQAAASFAIWWGDEPAPDVVDRTIEEGPCAA
jgi:shikimate dehydrogenase/3-dehydroquinate dehydratase type I